MAPAIVHFLVGAAIALLVATPFALRYEPIRRARLWIVAIGGLWGIAPDGYDVAPVFADRLEAFHDSRWADLFAFHYTLDQPPLADATLELTFLSILAFLVAITVFTAAGRQRSPRADSTPFRLVAVAASVGFAAVIAGATLGTGLYATDRLTAVAELFGRDGARFGGAVVLAWSVAAGIAIAAILEGTDESMPSTEPAAGITAGLVLVLPGWLAGVVALPIWMRVVIDAPRPIPYLHWQSLVGLVGFAVVFGICYAFGRRLADPVALSPGSEAGDSRSLEGKG